MPEKNILLRRLLTQQSYREALYRRWLQHQHTGVLSLPGLEQRVQGLLGHIKPHAAENFRRWPVGGPAYKDHYTFDQEVDVLLHFLRRRHEVLVEELAQVGK